MVYFVFREHVHVINNSVDDLQQNMMFIVILQYVTVKPQYTHTIY